MKTNFEMLTELSEKLNPKTRGILSREEVSLISDTLCLKEMTVLQLRNLRDFTVLFFNSREKGNVEEDLRIMDMTSGITCVIDNYIFGKGAEV